MNGVPPRAYAQHRMQYIQHGVSALRFQCHTNVPTGDGAGGIRFSRVRADRRRQGECQETQKRALSTAFRFRGRGFRTITSVKAFYDSGSPLMFRGSTLEDLHISPEN